MMARTIRDKLNNAFNLEARNAALEKALELGCKKSFGKQGQDWKDEYDALLEWAEGLKE